MTPTEKLRIIAQCLLNSTPWCEEELKGMDEWHTRVELLTDALIEARNEGRRGALSEAAGLFSIRHPYDSSGMGALIYTKQVAQAIRSLIVPEDNS